MIGFGQPKIWIWLSKITQILLQAYTEVSTLFLNWIDLTGSLTRMHNTSGNIAFMNPTTTSLVAIRVLFRNYLIHVEGMTTFVWRLVDFSDRPGYLVRKGYFVMVYTRKKLDLSGFLPTIHVDTRKKKIVIVTVVWQFSLLHLNGCVNIFKVLLELITMHIFVRLRKSLAYCEVVVSL